MKFHPMICVNMLSKFVYQCISFLLVCLCLLTACKEEEDSHSLLPEEGLVSLWDFTKDPLYDQIGHKQLKYGPPIHYGTSHDYRFDTIAGRVVIDTDCALPYRMYELPDTLSLVLTYVCDDEDDLDGDVLTFGHLGTLLTSDEGTLQQKGSIDTTYQTVLNYELPTHRSRAGNITLIYSLYALPYNGQGRVDYAQSLSAGGKQYQSYRYITKQQLKLNVVRLGMKKAQKLDSVRIHTPASLSQIALYNRVLTDKEQAMLMNTENVKVYRPDDDTTNLDWRWPFPVAMIVLVILQGVKQHKKRFKAVNRSYIINNYPQQPNAREMALAHVAAGWEVFGSSAQPIYPKNEEQLKVAVRSVKEAMATGCADEDLVVEYNKLAALVNHSRQFSYINPFSTYMAIMLLIMAAFEPFTDHVLVYMLGTRAFYIYYLTAIAVIVCGFAERYRGSRGKSIPHADRVMETMVKAGQILVMSGTTVVSSVVAVVTVIAGMLSLWLKIALSCIVDFVVVVASTGKVVAAGSTGFISGLLIGGVVLFVLGKFLFLVFLFVLWCLVFLLPIISYYTTRHSL